MPTSQVKNQRRQRRNMANLLRQILWWMALSLSLAKSSSPYGRPDSAQGFIEEFTIAFLPPAAAGAWRGCIAHQRHVDFCWPRQYCQVDVNLNDFSIARIKEHMIGNWVPKQDQRIGVIMGVEARRSQSGRCSHVRLSYSTCSLPRRA